MAWACPVDGCVWGELMDIVCLSVVNEFRHEAMERGSEVAGEGVGGSGGVKHSSFFERFEDGMGSRGRDIESIGDCGSGSGLVEIPDDADSGRSEYFWPIDVAVGVGEVSV